MSETADKFAFKPWDKIARLRRGVTITEKIDGTNAHVFIADSKTLGSPDETICIPTPVAYVGDYLVYAGSRTRYLQPGKDTDNFGFAAWVKANAETLVKLGEGRHYGEWWGVGIQRGYGMRERRFSLFNTKRWFQQVTPEDKLLLGAVGVGTVPILAQNQDFTDGVVEAAMEELRINGSKAAPGFMQPEGIVVYHQASGQLFKRTLENDEAPKSIAA